MTRASFCLLALLLLVSLPCDAQTSSIEGTVLDPAGNVAIGAEVSVASASAHFYRRTATDEFGRYRITSLPLGAFILRTSASRFVVVEWKGEARTPEPIIHDVKLAVAGEAQLLTVTGKPIVNVDSSSSYSEVDDAFIEETPPAPANRAMSAVVESVPGVVEEENGRIHIRGSETQPQYVLDGIPIADNMSGAFGTQLDTENLRSAEVITGNIPAQFGDKLGGVVTVATKSGLGSPWKGKIGVSGGSFDGGAVDAELSGHIQNFGVFATADVSRSRRFLDPPEIENFHNTGGLAHLFSRIDWLSTSRDVFHVTLSANGSNFQIPNTLESEGAGQNQDQRLRDDLEALFWTHTFDAQTIFEMALSRRSASARLDHPQLSGFPYFLEQSRRQRTEGAFADIKREWKLGSFQAGGEAYRFPIEETFQLAVTDPELIDDPQSPLAGYTPATPFAFRANTVGMRTAVYAQNRSQFWDVVNLDVGVRFDHYRVLWSGNAVSPRLGVAYNLTRTGTVLRAAYNRLVQFPPLENLLLSSSETAARLSDETNASPVVPPERQNFYEFGARQRIGSHFQLDVVHYVKSIRDFADDEELLGTPIVFPVSIARAHIHGTEVRLDLTQFHRFTAYASYANANATLGTPITGGLFLGGEDAILTTPGVQLPADQDERNEVQFGVTYSHPSGAWMTLGGRYDSGLPTEFDATAYSTFDPRIQAELDPGRMRVKPRAVLNAAGGISFFGESNHPTALQLGVNNVLNRFYLYNFQSAFSGTHIGRPREIVARVVVHWRGQHSGARE
jgi:hypothetical protein